MPWYKSGTVSCTQNSTTVTGGSTAFAANARVGDAFLGPDGRWYEVVNIASDTVLSILPAYLGTSNSTGAYALVPMQGYVKDSADALRTLVNKFGALAASPSINALAALTGTANKLMYFTAGDAMALADFPGQARTLLAASSQSGQRTALGLGSAAVAPLLGTVAQVSGVPTGAVVERGSNANGEYVKFADGTLFCKGNIPSTAIGASTVLQLNFTPAAAPVNTDYFAVACVQPLSSGDFYGCVYKVNNSTSRVDFGFRNGSTVQNFTGHYILFGRWF